MWRRSGGVEVAGVQWSQDFGATWTNVGPGLTADLLYPDPAGRPIAYYTEDWRDGVCLVAGTQGFRQLNVQALEKPDWSLPFTASTTDNWLALSASSGTTPSSLQITIDPRGLAPGSYQGTIQLASPLAAGSPLVVPVRLSVIPGAALGPAYDLKSFAGTGQPGFAGDGGPASEAQLAEAAGVALDASGTLYIADTGNHRVRKVSPDGVMHTIAGAGVAGLSGDNGPALLAYLRRPMGVVTTTGNVYVADTSNGRVRLIDSAGFISTVFSTGLDTSPYHSDSFPVTQPRGLAVDPAGRLLVTDSQEEIIVELPANAAVRVLAYRLDQPTDVAVDGSGMLYVADTGSHRILKIDRDGNTTVVAGTGVPGFDGDGGAATAASLSSPEGVAVDPAGQVYIADTGNHRLRVISPQGIIRTVAGTGKAGPNGIDGPAAGAQLNQPADLAVEGSGALYVAAETAPGALFSIFGAELATGTDQALGVPWPATLAGASVTVSGRAAPLYYAGPNQINAQVPYQTALGTSQLIVSVGQTLQRSGAADRERRGPWSFPECTGPGACSESRLQFEWTSEPRRGGQRDRGVSDGARIAGQSDRNRCSRTIGDALPAGAAGDRDHRRATGGGSVLGNDAGTDRPGAGQRANPSPYRRGLSPGCDGRDEREQRSADRGTSVTCECRGRARLSHRGEPATKIQGGRPSPAPVYLISRISFSFVLAAWSILPM
jgi:sugar lactone lactonase YvrE